MSEEETQPGGIPSGGDNDKNAPTEDHVNQDPPPSGGPVNPETGETSILSQMGEVVGEAVKEVAKEAGLELTDEQNAEIDQAVKESVEEIQDESDSENGVGSVGSLK